MILNHFQKQIGGNQSQTHLHRILRLNKSIKSHRLILPSRSSAATKYITDATHGTPASKVFENNIDEDSFIGVVSTRIQTLMEKSKIAIFSYAPDVLVSEEYLNCKVLVNNLEIYEIKKVIHNFTYVISFS